MVYKRPVKKLPKPTLPRKPLPGESTTLPRKPQPGEHTMTPRNPRHKQRQMAQNIKRGRKK